MGEVIIFTDPVVDRLILTTEMFDEPGQAEASCLADGCTWETSGYVAYVEDDCYNHVDRYHPKEFILTTTDTSDDNTSPSLSLVEEFSDRHPAVMEKLRWLDCGHLPYDLRIVAEIIAIGVRGILPLVDDGPQLTLALNELIIAKDALVRQRILRLEKERE